jgi:AGZA family xanthine/uracil permease-like MFS transporter
LLPNIANWAQSQVDGALGAAGTTAQAVGLDKLAGNGVIYRGMELFGGGATLAGLILGAIACFIIDRQFDKAAIYAGIGAVLAFFGFINGTQLAFGNSAPVALGYLVLAVTCLAFGRTKLSYVAPPVELSPADALTDQA